jgi:hypothetical protein
LVGAKAELQLDLQLQLGLSLVASMVQLLAAATSSAEAWRQLLEQRR